MAEYIVSFDQGLKIDIRGVEIPISIPDMPPIEQMVNYGLPRHQQIFRRIDVPVDLQRWDKEREREFVEREWHRRYNGVWILIGGDPVYLTGAAYVFFNYWRAESGDFPIFRFEAVEFFQILYHVERDPKTFGIFDVKARRLGDTEKTLCYGWEYTTRYRNSWFGMMNKNDEDAQENFDRVVMSNRDMVYFFKPKMTGFDMPKKELIFRYKTTTQENLSQFETIPELRSRVDFRPTVFGAYDGKRLRFFHGDEPSKIRVSRLAWTEQWPVVKECLALNNGKNIIGKAALTTTIEDMDEGDSIDEMSRLWEASNPLHTNDAGQTVTGLIRVFRGYWLAAETDEFGRHKVKEATEDRDSRIKQMQEGGFSDEIIAYKRKFPADITEALAIPETDCILLPYLLDTRIADLQRRQLLGENYNTKPVRGNLHWSKGIGSDVYWQPDPAGKWYISTHPLHPNKKDFISGYMAPGSKESASMGVDPVDDYKPSTGGSYGAFAIHLSFDHMRELPESDCMTENPKRALMITDRCVCTYRFRPDNPYDFYEHALMTAMYYGIDMLVEKTKSGLISWCKNKGFHRYLAFNPFSRASIYGDKRTDADYGIPATNETIAAYVRELKAAVKEKIDAQTHLDLLHDHRKFTGEANNRTKRDLTVAYGWALVKDASLRLAQEKKQKHNKRRFASPIKTYQYVN